MTANKNTDILSKIKNSETSQENKQTTSELYNEAKNIIKIAKEKGGDTTQMQKEYERVRVEIIEALKEDRKITTKEIGTIKKEVEDMKIINKIQTLLNSKDSNIQKYKTILKESEFNYKDPNNLNFIIQSIKLIKDGKLEIGDINKIIKNMGENGSFGLLELFRHSKLTLKIIDGNFDELTEDEYKLAKSNRAIINTSEKFKEKILNDNYGKNNQESKILNERFIAYIDDPKIILMIKDFIEEISPIFNKKDKTESDNKKIETISNKYLNFDKLKAFNIDDSITFIVSFTMSNNFDNIRGNYMGIIGNLNEEIYKRGEKININFNGEDLRDRNKIKEVVIKKYPDITEKNIEKYTSYLNNETQEIPELLDNSENPNKIPDNLKKHGKPLSEILSKPGVTIDAKGNLKFKNTITIGENSTIEMGSDGELIVISSLGYKFKFDQDLNKSGDKMFEITDKMDFLGKIGFGFFRENFAKMITRIKTIHGSKIPGLTSINIDTNSSDFLNNQELMVIGNIFYKLGFLNSPSDAYYSERPATINKTQFNEKIKNIDFYSAHMEFQPEMFDQAMEKNVYEKESYKGDFDIGDFNEESS